MSTNKIWIAVANINEIPEMGSRVLFYKNEEIALFKTREGNVYAVNNLCPHKKGKLSEGLVHDGSVTCPLHNWVIDLETGVAKGEDNSCTNIYETQIKSGLIYLNI